MVADEQATPKSVPTPEMTCVLSPLEINPVTGSIGTETPSWELLLPTARHCVDDTQKMELRLWAPVMASEACPLEMTPVDGFRGTVVAEVYE